MTTQHTDHEYNDADAGVVEHSSALEAATGAASTPSSDEPKNASPTTSVDETAVQREDSKPSVFPTAQEDQQSTTSEAEGDAASVRAPAESAQQAPVTLSHAESAVAAEMPKQQQDEQKGQVPTAADSTEGASAQSGEQRESEVSAPAESANPAEATELAAQSDDSAPRAGEEALPLVAGEDEVRPFTDYIEEFRQAEARLNASLQEAPIDLFATSAIAEDASMAMASSAQESPATSTPSVESALTEELTPAAQEAAALGMVDIEASPIQQEAVLEVAKEITPETSSTTEQQPQKPAERPVSPLLRPASRLRLPRHAAARRSESQIQEPAANEKEGQPAEATEPAPAVEQPKPARRYRFDRPATAASSTGTPPPRASTPPPSAEGTNGANGQNGEARTRATTTNGTAQVEQQKQPTAQETPTVIEAGTAQFAASIAPAESITLEQGRRRQGREKETTPAPLALAPAEPAIEEPAPAAPEEVAPEDLPPLEYSELQKASSRRRRRHRTSSGSMTAATSKQAVSTAPAASTAPATDIPAAQTPVTSPTAPKTSPVVPNQYSIISGYTVQQMNGNEVNGPFMGPEPSPARGSVITRDGRTARAEAQRSQVLPARSEPTVSPSSINHLVNAITQAIQTQSDRMVAELRRANQAPTNVSVSLPPFPSTERVGVFVDVANLLYSARTLRIAVDFGKLLDFLRGNRRLVRAHAYCPTSPQPSDDQMFLQAVKGLGYRITTKNYKTFSSGAKKADLDLDLCMDVVRLVEGKAVDCIVLVSGDSDFMPMLDYCSDHGVRVEVAAFDEAMSATLRQSCDLFINLSMLEEIRA